MKGKGKYVFVAIMFLIIGCVLGTSVVTDALEVAKVDYKSNTTSDASTQKRRNWVLKNIPSGEDCIAQITTLYEDDEYTYTVSSPCYIKETYVFYTSGKKVNIKTALTRKLVTIQELIDAGAKITSESKYKVYNWEIKKRNLNMVCTDSLETIYEDDDYVYQVPNSCYAKEYYLKFNTGKKYSLAYSLRKKLVTPDQLIEKGLKITKNPKVKPLTWKLKRYRLAMTCTEALQTIYEDNDYEYQVPNSCYGREYHVVYSNGESYTIIEALKKKMVTPDELIEKGAKITKKAKSNPKKDWDLVRRPLVTMCTDALQTFYEDDEYEYQVPNSCYAAEHFVVFDNGDGSIVEYAMTYALKKKIVTVDELIAKGAQITKLSKVKVYNWHVENRPVYTMCTQSLYTVYEDNNYLYQVPNSCYAMENYIVFADGREYSIKEVLSEKIITVDELIASGLKIYKMQK